MGYKDWSEADKKALAADLRDVIVPAAANAVMAELVAHNPDVTARAALRRAAATPGMVRTVGSKVGAKIDALDDSEDGGR